MNRLIHTNVKSTNNINVKPRSFIIKPRSFISYDNYYCNYPVGILKNFQQINIGDHLLSRTDLGIYRVFGKYEKERILYNNKNIFTQNQKWLETEPINQYKNLMEEYNHNSLANNLVNIRNKYEEICKEKIKKFADGEIFVNTRYLVLINNSFPERFNYCNLSDLKTNDVIFYETENKFIKIKNIVRPNNSSSIHYKPSYFDVVDMDYNENDGNGRNCGKLDEVLGTNRKIRIDNNETMQQFNYIVVGRN